MSRQTIYVDKPYEDWTFEEKIEAVNAVFTYLKHDGIYNPFDEAKRTIQTRHHRQIQHVTHVVTQTIDGVDYGFSDELVYVGRSIKSNDTTSDTNQGDKTFIGLSWGKSIDARLRLLDELHVHDIRCALFAVMMHAGANNTN